MSRTYKDRPTFVKIYEMMKAGKYSHMHFYLDRPEFYAREMTIEIDKKEAKEIYDFRKYLVENDIDFVEEEKKAVRSLKRDASPGSHALVSYKVKPKLIKFTYEEEYEYGHRFSRYCSDVKYYDIRSQTDTRDNKIASCTPFPRYRYHDDLDEPENKGRTRRNASFSNIAKAFNNGSDYDDLENFENDSFWIV